MKKLGIGILISLIVLVAAGVSQALVFSPAQVLPSGVQVTVPNIAVDRAKALGYEPGTLEKVVFIHYANGKSEVKGAKAPTCYKLLGVKWRSLPVSYVVDPALEATVGGAVGVSAETWDAATTKELFNDSYTIASANWDSDYPDGKNEYSFGNYSQSGVIAVTVVWSGVPLGSKGRQIIEYDVLFDTDYPWGDADVSGFSVMDLQNIAVHETGHGVGLGDVYDSACGAVTMYGYSDYGETSKRTLEQPDITGLRKLYGI